MHIVVSSSIFILEVFLTVLAMAIALSTEKRCLCAPRILFVSHQMFMLIYIIFFLNPFCFERESSEEIARLLCVFEVFHSTFIDAIYLWHLHLTASESGLPFLSITLFLLSAFFFFISVSISEWMLTDPLALCASKLFSYQLIQVVLLLFLVVCITRLTFLQDTESQKPLCSFVPYYISTFLALVTATIVPRFTYVFSILLGIHSKHETLEVLLKSLLFITPLFNVVFVVLVNCQNPDSRLEMKKSIERSLRGMKTGPLPRINVQEPTTSSAVPERSHIAQNLMRNPLNSFSKLQRRTTEPAPIPQNSLCVPNEQRYVAKQENEEGSNAIATEREILSMPNADERGFRTVAMLKRASEIGMRFQGIRADSARASSSPSTPKNAETPVNQATAMPVPGAHPPQPLDVHCLGFLVNTSTSSAPTREKRAVERIKEMLRRQGSSTDECEK